MMTDWVVVKLSASPARNYTENGGRRIVAQYKAYKKNGRFRDYSWEIEHFKKNKEMHDLPLEEICAFYRMGSNAVRKILFPAAGRLTLRQKQQMEADKIRSHPLFGTPGQRAPCINPDLAKKLGISVDRVRKLRYEAGVKPMKECWDNCGGYREFSKPHYVPPGGYRLTKAEKEAYNLCKLVNSWGR